MFTKIALLFMRDCVYNDCFAFMRDCVYKDRFAFVKDHVYKDRFAFMRDRVYKDCFAFTRDCVYKDCFTFVLFAGNEHRWRSVWVGEDVSAAGDKVGPSDEESCRSSDSLHGERTAGTDQTDWIFRSCTYDITFYLFIVQLEQIKLTGFSDLVRTT